MPDNFSIDYSLGMVSGEVALETLNLGNPDLIITQQAFGLTTNSTADFHSTTCDGVFVSGHYLSFQAKLPMLPSHKLSNPRG